MKNIVKSIVFVTLLSIISSCKNEPKITYQHTDKPDIITCEGIENEA